MDGKDDEQLKKGERLKRERDARERRLASWANGERRPTDASLADLVGDPMGHTTLGDEPPQMKRERE